MENSKKKIKDLAHSLQSHKTSIEFGIKYKNLIYLNPEIKVDNRSVDDLKLLTYHLLFKLNVFI